MIGETSGNYNTAVKAAEDMNKEALESTLLIDELSPALVRSAIDLGNVATFEKMFIACSTGNGGVVVREWE